MKGGDFLDCKGDFELHFITENDSKCALLDSFHSWTQILQEAEVKHLATIKQCWLNIGKNCEQLI